VSSSSESSSRFDDHDAAVAFYRDVLGLDKQAAFEGDGDARVAILHAGRATLKLANRAQKRLIDDVETGTLTSPPFRLAFEVSDTPEAVRDLTDAGARLIGGPVETPWHSLNARFEGPADLQLTLFQELKTLDERERSAEFSTEGRRRAR
jgi:catechol 2,3-dioxygenase-like lactoylglutathione lyase family enzyme